MPSIAFVTAEERRPMVCPTRTFRTFLLATLGAGMGAFTTAQADLSSKADLHARYFLVVWSYQAQDNDVVKAHTFASFYSGDDLANGKVNPPTISWLPSTGVVNPFGIARGRNFSLAQTLTMACRTGRESEVVGAL